MVLWWKNHREYGIERNRGIRNATSNSHDAAIQDGSELYKFSSAYTSLCTSLIIVNVAFSRSALVSSFSISALLSLRY